MHIGSKCRSVTSFKFWIFLVPSKPWSQVRHVPWLIVQSAFWSKMHYCVDWGLLENNFMKKSWCFFAVQTKFALCVELFSSRRGEVVLRVSESKYYKVLFHWPIKGVIKLKKTSAIILQKQRRILSNHIFKTCFLLLWAQIYLCLVAIFIISYQNIDKIIHMNQKQIKILPKNNLI